MIKVEQVDMLDSNETVYKAWEPTELLAGKHSTKTFIDNNLYGQIGRNPDKTLFEHLESGSNKRWLAVKKAFQKEYNKAYEAIYNEHPELKETEHIKLDGKIIVKRKEG